MPKKKNVKKILIIVVILFALILGVRELALNAIERAKLENKTYTSISDFTSVKEIAKYMGCTYIKEEPSTGEKYDIDIYLKFKYPLYTDEVSNEDYYYQMIALMLEYLNYQNIRLIDQENDIVIAVEGDKENKTIKNLLINGEDNYFGKMNTEKILQNYETTQTQTLDIQSSVLAKLIENDWEEKKVSFGTQESICDNYKIYFDEGIEAKSVGKVIFNLVLTQKYKENIVNGLNALSDEDTIKQTLGEPDFTITNPHTIGYKSSQLYIFFNTEYKRVSIYRIQNTTEEEKEKIKSMLAQLSVDGNGVMFASNLTDMWEDYDSYEYSDGYISLQYTLRGIKFEVNVTENNGLLLYNNYTGTLIRDLKNGENISNVYVMKEDLIYTYEQKYETKQFAQQYAISNAIDEEEKTGIKSNGLGSKKYFIQNISKDISYKLLRFISLNSENYNFDLDLRVDSYLWLNDDNFAYSIRNQGIYRYNVITKETQIIIEGTEEFDLREYNSGYLKYDDKEVIYIVE